MKRVTFLACISLLLIAVQSAAQPSTQPASEAARPSRVTAKAIPSQRPADRGGSDTSGSTAEEKTATVPDDLGLRESDPLRRPIPEPWPAAALQLKAELYSLAENPEAAEFELSSRNRTLKDGSTKRIRILKMREHLPDKRIYRIRSLDCEFTMDRSMQHTKHRVGGKMVYEFVHTDLNTGEVVERTTSMVTID